MSNAPRYLAAILLLLALFITPWLSAGSIPAPPITEAPRITLLALGDVHFGRYVGAEIERSGDFDLPLREIAPALREADLALLNLEGPLVEQPPPYIPATTEEAEKLLLIGDARAAGALARAGVRAVGLANNHILDAGPAGMRATIRALRDAGIAVAGAGESAEQARRPALLEMGGLRVALLARSAVPSNDHLRQGGALYPGPAYLDPADPTAAAQLAADVERARAQADLVLLMLHWGREYTTQPTEEQRALASAAASAGADLVIGAHPHVAQPFVLLPGPAGGGRGTPVAYSLGNAVFDQFWPPETRQGLALAGTLGAAGVEELRLLPLPREGYTPRLGQANDPQVLAPIARIHEQSSPELRQLVLSAATVQGRSESYELLPALGYFATDRRRELITTDLAGDGTFERISLRDGQIAVRQEKPEPGRPRLLWGTPSSWSIDSLRVVEADELLANGHELAFTVWKPSIATEYIPPHLVGKVGQHFFLFGERDGAIKPVWNSSILPDPILDFDFMPGPPLRLLTLEGRYDEDGARAVAVWSWTGFGYALEWRSQPLATADWHYVDWRGDGVTIGK